MGHFQVSGDSRHLLKILFYGTLEIENGFEQLYGGGRCLELHAQGTMSVRICFFGRVTTGSTAAFHNTENAAPTFIRIHLPADDNLVDKLLCSNQQTKNCMLYSFLLVVGLLVLCFSTGIRLLSNKAHAAHQAHEKRGFDGNDLLSLL